MLQGLATRGEPRAASGLDPALLVRLLRRPAFLGTVVLDVVGFSLHVAALTALPLFLVQAVIAGYVAVTAVISVRVFSAPLTRAQWCSVGAVVAGLAMLAPTASSEAATSHGGSATLVLLAVVVVVTALAAPAGRLPPAAGAVVLGLLAGVSYGVVALSARLLPSGGVGALLSSGGTYVLLLAGAVAFLLYSTGMQRGSVTTTTAALVITQTAVPAVVGVLLLGDTVRAGLAPLAVAGFLLALGGAVGLGRVESGEHAAATA